MLNHNSTAKAILGYRLTVIRKAGRTYVQLVSEKRDAQIHHFETGAKFGNQAVLPIESTATPNW